MNLGDYQVSAGIVGAAAPVSPSIPRRVFFATLLNAPCLLFMQNFAPHNHTLVGLSDNVHARRIGLTLNGKWTLNALLGVGGMGAVYAATHRNGKSAAVKVLHPELAMNPQTVSRFMREGYVANAIGHSDVVAALDDDCSEDGLYYLVIERLEGMSLEQAQSERGRPFAVAEALALIRQVLDVMAAAHQHGIVHRDLNPNNVFLLTAGGIKVLDFGIAKLHEAPTGPNATLIGSVFGTPGFIPPEQARGRTELIDARADVWALGALLYCMLSGQRLHPAATPNESLLRAMCEPAPALQAVLPSVPSDVAELVDRALAFDREDRWPDAGAMLERATLVVSALEANAEEADSLPSHSATPDAPRTSSPGVMMRAFSAFSALSSWTKLARAPHAFMGPVHSTRLWMGGLALALCVAIATGVVVRRASRAPSSAVTPPVNRAANASDVALPPAASRLSATLRPAAHERASTRVSTEAASPKTQRVHQLRRTASSRRSARAAPRRAVAPTRAAPTRTFAPTQPARAMRPPTRNPLQSRQ